MIKKLLFLIGLLFVFTSCTQVEDLQEGPSIQKLRTVQEAVNIAEDLQAILSKASRSIPADVENVVVAGHSASRSLTDTLLYIVNYTDENGFAIISASKSGEALLGFAEKGTYDEETAKENTNFDFFMAQAMDYVVSNLGSSNDGLIPDPSRPVTLTSYIYPRVDMEWGQVYPEGMFCPNGIAGCVQTATAQILSYLEQPTYIHFEYPERDITSAALLWNVIKKHKKSTNNTDAAVHSTECIGKDGSHKTLARLCREIGYINSAMYNENSTGVYRVNDIRALNKLVPDNTEPYYYSFDSTPSLYERLRDDNCVAMIMGRDNTSGGHAWVCDGAKLVTTIRTNILFDGTVEKETTESIYYHFNWGWNGSYNGYFASGVFAPSERASNEPKPFFTKSRAGYNFNDNVQFIIVKKL